MWLKLLHYDSQGRRSEIFSEDFFLSPEGRTDPAMELKATLLAYGQSWPEDPNLHPRCRFPARYFWLSRHVTLPDYQAKEPRCERLARWVSLDQLRSVSLLLVSGYFANPASTFGHALLRLNMRGPESLRLFDPTINFGALVPRDEWMPRYVVYGLFGGYESGFSDKYFYAEDLVYARTEMRDIWEYEINLPEERVHFLALHLWEVVGKKFKYYFLNKNCAYRLAELLELTSERVWLENPRLWYAPIEMFHRLQGLDRTVPDGLIRSVRFIPSSARELRHQFRALSPGEISRANRVIRNGSADLSQRLATLDPTRQAAVLDAVLAYYQHRLIAEEPEPRATTRAAKDTALVARLQLPTRIEPESPVPDLPSPAEGSAPLLTGVGVASDAGGKHYGRARFSVFSYDQAGRHGLDGELVVLDVAGGVDTARHLVLDQLDLIRVRRLNTDSAGYVGEDAWSWQTRVGASRLRRGQTERIDADARFGAGRAARWGGSLTAFAMLDVSVQTGPSPVTLEPNLGLVAGIGRWGTFLQAGAPYEFLHEGWRRRVQVAARYQLSQHQSLVLDFARDADTRRAAFSLHGYW